MVRKIGLSAVAVALIAGAVATSAAEARRGPNRIAANGTAVNQKPAAPAAKKGAVAARKAPGEGSVRSVIFVQLPAK